MTGRIAVIDDEAPNRAYLQTLLGTAGFEVQAADGGNEGVALVKKERPTCSSAGPKSRPS